MHVIGTCPEMCPKSERELREREGILHRLEWLKSSVTEDAYSNTRNVSSGRGSVRRSLPKADINRTIKSFSRSAAGADKMIAEELRPAPVLIRTVKYLCHEVLPSKEEPFNVIYDFVFDRLRSVRQDLVIQRICDENAIFILETIIRFHVYAAFRLQDETIDKFDPHINRKHLIDCLKRLVSFYEINNFWKFSRNEFEILYLIVAPESFDTISRALSIKNELNDPAFNSAIELCFAHQSHNYARYFLLLEKFKNPLIVSYCCQQTKSLRSLAYQAMSMAYGVSSSKVPVDEVARVLRYPSKDDATNDLRLVSEILSDEKDKDMLYARFKKTNKDLCISKENQLSNKLGSLHLDFLEPNNIKTVSLMLICPPFKIPLSTK